ARLAGAIKRVQHPWAGGCQERVHAAQERVLTSLPPLAALHPELEARSPNSQKQLPSTQTITQRPVNSFQSSPRRIRSDCPEDSSRQWPILEDVPQRRIELIDEKRGFCPELAKQVLPQFARCAGVPALHTQDPQVRRLVDDRLVGIAYRGEKDCMERFRRDLVLMVVRLEALYKKMQHGNDPRADGEGSQRALLHVEHTDSECVPVKPHDCPASVQPLVLQHPIRVVRINVSVNPV